MNQLLLKAKKMLRDHNFTCVMMKEDSLGVYTSKDHGIKPILAPLNEDSTFFEEGWVADQVIGKSAAMLLVKGGVCGIYGEVMSKAAVEFLERTDIEFTYGSLVEFIENRTKDDMCPLEKTVLAIYDVDVAHQALNQKVNELMGKKK